MSYTNPRTSSSRLGLVASGRPGSGEAEGDHDVALARVGRADRAQVLPVRVPLQWGEVIEGRTRDGACGPVQLVEQRAAPNPSPASDPAAGPPPAWHAVAGTHRLIGGSSRAMAASDWQKRMTGEAAQVRYRNVCLLFVMATQIMTR
jgi:hypothetical protein